MQRIGVFVCHCGTNIAATVDVKAVAEALTAAHEQLMSRQRYNHEAGLQSAI